MCFVITTLNTIHHSVIITSYINIRYVIRDILYIYIEDFKQCLCNIVYITEQGIQTGNTYQTAWIANITGIIQQILPFRIGIVYYRYDTAHKSSVRNCDIVSDNNSDIKN